MTEQEAGSNQQRVTVDQYEALRNRLNPFLGALYQRALELGLKSPLTEEQIDELLSTNGLEVLVGKVTPHLLLPFVSVESEALAKAANLQGVAMADFSSKTGIEEETIKSMPWPVALTQMHLLGMMGTPINDHMARIYPQPETPLAEEVA